MNKHGNMCCQHSKPRKKNSICRKIGCIMLMFGAVTAMALFLPLKCIVIFMCLVMIICGSMLIKK